MSISVIAEQHTAPIVSTRPIEAMPANSAVMRLRSRRWSWLHTLLIFTGQLKGIIDIPSVLPQICLHDIEPIIHTKPEDKRHGADVIKLNGAPSHPMMAVVIRKPRQTGSIAKII